MKNRLSVVAIFLGSFISFALEPMIGRALIPVFGGTPMVWVTCLGAFQCLMVGGYFYAERGGSANHLRRHLALLILAGIWCCSLYFFAGDVISTVSSLTGIGPVDVLISVLALVGVAFVLLSANATIVQALSGGDYRLYAVSNVGSLLGLFAYPVLIEPFVGLSNQWLMLGFGILIYTGVLFAVSHSVQTLTACESSVTKENRDSHPILYFLIPAVSCALLNGVTTHLTLDIAPLPLLWAVLLGVFLLSYIIGFSGRTKSLVWAILSAPSAFYALHALLFVEGNDIANQLGASIALLFFVCTFLHTWLYELRPGKGELPRYYLLNVVGGAVGGLLVSVVVPLLFASVLEYPILIYISVVALLGWSFVHLPRKVSYSALAVAAILLAAFQLLALNHVDKEGKKRVVIQRSRGFFGTVHVNEVVAGASDGKKIAIHEFYHGNTVHGIQVMRKEMERMPTCYYTPYSSGFAIWGHQNYQSNKTMRVEMVGLGIGVLFAYSRLGDYYHAYEISPEVLDVAKDPKLFTFFSSSPAQKEIVLGDARKGLEKEIADGVEPYDVMIVDAFTGDNLPYHLSTKEAFDIYFKLLKPDGVLCVNFSNKHLDLRPYIKRIGLEYGIEPIAMKSTEDKPRIGFATDVAFFTRHPEKLRSLPVGTGKAFQLNLSSVEPMREMPTDDKGSFLSLVKFRR